MLDLRIKEYLSLVGIHRIIELDKALIETFGQGEGDRHVEKLEELFEQSEKRLVHGTGDTPYLRRQEELVNYLNQSLQMSLLAASFYDCVFFRRVMEYLLRQEAFFEGDIFDIGCGNGILTCFLALQHPDSLVTGIELSPNAVSVAEELAERLQVSNVRFIGSETVRQKKCDTLFSCRTVHENVAWRPLCEESKRMVLSVEEQTKLYEEYAKELSVLVKSGRYLVSVERYEDDSAYTSLIRALEHWGFRQMRGTSMQFSCKNGDETAAFQAMVYQKIEENEKIS